MNLYFKWILCFLLTSNLFAQESSATNPSTPTPATPPTAEVVKIVGSVKLEGVLLSKDTVISKPGVIETGPSSFVVLKIAKWGNTITIGPFSRMVLNFAEDKKYTLENGTCRWKTIATDVTKTLTNKESAKGKIYTRYASMGVRGTDFLLTSQPLFGETEIVMFDGEVQMDNLEDKKNSIIIKKGQWGGFGGRFGKKINPPLTLSNEALMLLQRSIEAN